MTEKNNTNSNADTNQQSLPDKLNEVIGGAHPA